MLLGFGSLVAGSVGVVGSGAFTSVSANRGVDLRVAKDPNAYLGLEQRTDGVRSLVGDGKLELRFPGLRDSAEGQGPAPNSIYEFDDTGFTITNQGTQEIGVFAEQVEDEAPYIEIYEHTDKERESLKVTSPATLSPGNSVTVGIRINTLDVSAREEMYTRTLTIKAQETEQ